uniref:Homeobox domain-containing protein n=1 Tax=Strongyloides venezuelensis TaxID=75913 RepID=A0A0K0F211_STRVS
MFSNSLSPVSSDDYLTEIRSMSSNNSTMVGEVTIKVIIRPSLGFMDVKDPHLSKLSIEENITLNSRISIKDLSKSVMKRYNLGDVDNDFQVLVQHSNMEFYPLSSFFHDMNTKIGSVASQFGEIMTIKIFVPLKICEDIRIVKVEGVYKNIINYLLSRVDDKENQLPDAIIQYKRYEAEGCPIRQLPLETLSRMDQELSHAFKSSVTSMSKNDALTSDKDNSLNFASVPRDDSTSPLDIDSGIFQYYISTLDSIIEDFSSSSSSEENQEEVQLDARRKRRVKYDKEIELPILERWYKSSSYTHDFGRYAEAINTISGRTGLDRLNSENIRSWFRRRRARERKDQKLLMNKL